MLCRARLASGSRERKAPLHSRVARLHGYRWHMNAPARRSEKCRTAKTPAQQGLRRGPHSPGRRLTAGLGRLPFRPGCAAGSVSAREHAEAEKAQKRWVPGPSVVPSRVRRGPASAGERPAKADADRYRRLCRKTVTRAGFFAATRAGGTPDGARDRPVESGPGPSGRSAKCTDSAAGSPMTCPSRL